MKISVCIPTYNQELYLKKAIDSVLNQTLLPREIIVSNDCSTDNTAGLLNELQKSIPILKIINQPQNLGIARNTDACMRAASGNYIVRLDSDDLLNMKYCECLSNLLDTYPEAGYAHGNVIEIDQHDNTRQERVLFRKKEFQNADEALMAGIKGYKVAANIVMFRKAALEQANYCIGRPDYVEDYHLSVTLSSNGWGNAFSNHFLSYYRVWIDAAKVRQRRKMLEINGLVAVFEQVLSPAFKKRNWNTNLLQKSRKQLAKEQASSLGWDIYSSDEKEELEEAILKLDASPETKKYITVYLSGKEPKPQLLESINTWLKEILKPVLRQIVKL